MEQYGLPAQNAGTTPRKLARELGLAASLEIRGRRDRLPDYVRLDQRHLPVGRLAGRAADRIHTDCSGHFLFLRIGVCPHALSLVSGLQFSRRGAANSIT